MFIIPLILLCIGIFILITGAEALVRGASSIAKKFGISSIVIGLTIVAFGTSAPELFVNVLSAWKGSTELAIANVVGSNMANILLILGLGAAYKPLLVKTGTTFKEIPYALLGMVLIFLLGNDTILDREFAMSNFLSRADGIAFIAFFIIFLYYTYGMSKVKGEEEKVETYSWSTSSLLVVIGLIGLGLGGQLIVSNAIKLATMIGMSESLVGLTIIAVGTSLPELATTIMAVRKGHTDIAIGNIVGSNIFNVFWILGITAVIQPIDLDANANMDIIFTTLVTLLLFIFMFIGKKHVLSRWQGISFILLYIGYMIFAIMR